MYIEKQREVTKMSATLGIISAVITVAIIIFMSVLIWKKIIWKDN
jgi:hypothetical protein